MTSAAELLGKLVACRSDAGEAGMAELLQGLLQPWGARVSVPSVLPGRPNLIATFPGRDDSRSLMLEAHSDTVPAEGEVVPVVRDGRLYGRGACDTKGAMTAMLLAIEIVLAELGRLPITLHFVSTCNEEAGAAGAHQLMASGFRAGYAVVGEPTELALVYAHKGALRLRLRAEGKAAHSSTPERGVNAIYKMCAAVGALEQQAVPRLAAIRHPELGHPTLSVGVIRGGSQVNVVPDWCEIEVDRRLVPGEDQAAVVDSILGVLPPGLSHAVTEYYPPLGQDPAGPLVQRLAALGASGLATAPWASNAGVFAAAGISSVLFGPGSIRQAHTRDEFIELAQVEAASRVYAALLRSSAEPLAAAALEPDRGPPRPLCA